MDRRQFHCLAGSLVLSHLLYKPRCPQIDLQEWCLDYDETRRYDMKHPFEQCGNTFATDARAIIRIPQPVPTAKREDIKLPPVDSLPWVDEAHWKPWPREKRIHDPRKQLCPICKGKRRVGAVRECRTCGGYGATMDVYETECKPCEGTGYTGGVKCDYCRYGEVDYAITLEDRLIAPLYDARIRKLDCVEYYVQREYQITRKYQQPLGGKDQLPIAFRFNGGDGLLMPLANMT